MKYIVFWCLVYISPYYAEVKTEPDEFGISEKYYVEKNEIVRTCDNKKEFESADDALAFYFRAMSQKNSVGIIHVDSVYVVAIVDEFRRYDITPEIETRTTFSDTAIARLPSFYHIPTGDPVFIHQIQN